jgi:lipid A 4'-phosphatase
MTMTSWDPPLLRGWRCSLLLALVMVFLIFPQVDLGVSALFYDPASGRFVSEGPILNLIRKGVPPILYGTLVFVTLLWLGDRFVPGPRMNRPSFRQVVFLFASLALGPGLLVNGVFKEWWGRARPSDIEEFGREALFTPAWMITDYCETNCSFVSGHASMAFWTVALALLLPRPWRRPAFAGALVFGAVVGGARIVVGGHFLSDVVFAGIMTVALTLWLHRALVPEDV